MSQSKRLTDGDGALGGTVWLRKPRPAGSAPPAPKDAPAAGAVAGPHAGAATPDVTPFPNAGDELFGYLIRGELGRGAFARAYLAEQGDLAGRPVVLKVSAIEGGEPQTLAQMQHTHIVPIYSLHEDRLRGLRAVCMPYFGGATLTRVLQHLAASPARPTRGSELAAALVAVQ